jgi:hypothetical protein
MSLAESSANRQGAADSRKDASARRAQANLGIMTHKSLLRQLIERQA